MTTSDMHMVVSNQTYEVAPEGISDILFLSKQIQSEHALH